MMTECGKEHPKIFSEKRGTCETGKQKQKN